MSGIMGKFFKSRQKNTQLPSNVNNSARPGDGIGYPVPYHGSRIAVTHEFLKKCKSLAPYSGVYRINDATVMKTGEATRMSEASAMRLVAEKTSIPVPKVFDAYVQESDGRGVIIMEYIDGERLDEAWPQCTPEQQAHIIEQLRNYLSELRAIKSETFCAVGDGPCFDQFFPEDDDERTTKYGPYQNEAEFREAITKALLARNDNSWSRMVSQFVMSLASSGPVLTHNDLAPRNILIRDGKVAAILDWELCGFFPEYWEYVKCYLWMDWDTAWTEDKIPDQILTPRLHELAYLLHARDIMR